MAGRIRSIKPEILEDERTAQLSHLEWRLFVSLWLIADDYGNLRGDPGYVQGQTLWASSETKDTVSSALTVLSTCSLLRSYSVRGQSYYHISGWSKHQKVDKPGKPRMPGPDEDDIESNSDVTCHSREPIVTLDESSRESRETPAPDLRPPTSDLKEALPRTHAIQPTVVPGPITDAAKRHLDLRRQLLSFAWDLGGVWLRKLQSEGVDPEAPNSWSGLPPADSPPMVNLRAIVDELLIGDRPDYAGARVILERRVLVAYAEGKRMGTGQYMTPARMWNRESFSIASAMSPEQAARGPRAGPTRSPASNRPPERPNPIRPL